MRKPTMCMPLLVKRLTELNEQLTTIAKLQKMENECDRSLVLHSKICDCFHHKLSTGEDKKRIPCNINTCKAKKKHTCLCKYNKTRVEVPEKQVEGAQDTATYIETYNEVDKKEEIYSEEIRQIPDISLVGSPKLEKIDSDMSVTKIISIRKNANNENDDIHKINNIEGISAEIPVQDSDDKSKSEEFTMSFKENVHDANAISKNNLKRIQKDLTNEKMQKKDLEEKLQGLQKQHSIKLKEDEHQISHPKDVLIEIKEQLTQARREIDTVTADRDKLLQTISTLKEEMNNISSKNVSLNCQCKDLKCKLQTISENETRSCTVVQDEVNHIKSISKQKEDILQAEITELKGLITELTNVTKIQERRICELTNVCKKQQCSLHKKNKLLMEKGCQIAEMQSLLNSYSCKCTGLQNDVINLQSSLNNESHLCKHLKEELERYKDDYNCMLNIKTKIIEEQDETIKKQKRLLQDSERMAQQAATEFEEIRNELVQEKETCESLKFALLATEAQLNQRHNGECKNCQSLMVELSLLDQQKQKALATAKEAFQKLCTSVRYFQRQLASERQQCKFLTLKLKEKQEEVEYVKEEVAHRKKMIVRRTSDFLS